MILLPCKMLPFKILKYFGKKVIPENGPKKSKHYKGEKVKSKALSHV